ncbi:MAG: NAD(P)H-binding protein [Alphaproteobacteria bacterium]|nr:NAD(P)H-binding protein [Alphaproteobacteria bacterium]
MTSYRFTLTVAFTLLLSAGPALSDSILVLGATGQLGARVVKLLVDQGEDVTVFVRESSNRDRLADLDVEYAIGDMMDEDSIDAAFQGRDIRVVINTARAPTALKDFYKLSSTYIANASVANRVEQIIHHGAVGAGSNMALHPDVPWARVPDLEPRMMDHGVAEEVFFSSGIPTTIIRNSRVWPDETKPSGNAIMTEDRTVMTPITRADLARFTMECLDNKECFGKVYHNKDDSLTWPPPSFGEGE